MTEAAPLMGVGVRLATSLDALAALAAHIRVETEPLGCDPRVQQILADIAAELLGTNQPITEQDRLAAVVGMTRSFLRQAVKLVDNPGRTGDWSQVDEAMLQGIGRLSGTIADVITRTGDTLPGLRARLDASDASFLDVGTGTAWLAIAMARAFPRLQISGIDVFAPALELARGNVAAERLTERITFVQQDVATLDQAGVYDAIWLPLPFLPYALVGPALDAAHRALKPGGWVLPGTFAGPADRLAELLLDLRTVRSGGHPWRSAELLAKLTTHGFADAQEVPRTWAAPVRLFGGRR